MRRRLLAVLLAATTAWGLAGCGGLRLESEGPPAASAGPEEQLRQQHALLTLHVAELAEHAASAQPDSQDAPLLVAVASDARAQLDVLGGVWEPAGRHLVPASPRGDAIDVEAALVEAADAAYEAALGADGDLAAMLAGMAVSRWLRADQLATALGREPGAVEPALPTELDPGAAADLIRTLDALGQAWEIVAARAEDPDPAREQAQARREVAQQLAEAARVADTEDDPRAVGYALETDDLAATIADLETDLLPLWLAQVPTTGGDDRRAVIDLALSAARESGLAEPGADVPAIAGR